MRFNPLLHGCPHQWDDDRKHYKGGSKSSSSASTTTQNVDRRQVVDTGSIGVSSDSSTVTINALDEGIVTKALDLVSASDAISGQGLTQLLQQADKMFTGTAQMIGKAQDTTLAQISQLQTAANDAKGAIDQKTMIIVGAVGLGAIMLSKVK